MSCELPSLWFVPDPDPLSPLRKPTSENGTFEAAARKSPSRRPGSENGTFVAGDWNCRRNQHRNQSASPDCPVAGLSRRFSFGSAPVPFSEQTQSSVQPPDTTNVSLTPIRHNGCHVCHQGRAQIELTDHRPLRLPRCARLNCQPQLKPASTPAPSCRVASPPYIPSGCRVRSLLPSPTCRMATFIAGDGRPPTQMRLNLDFPFGNFHSWDWELPLPPPLDPIASNNCTFNESSTPVTPCSRLAITLYYLAQLSVLPRYCTPWHSPYRPYNGWHTCPLWPAPIRHHPPETALPPDPRALDTLPGRA